MKSLASYSETSSLVLNLYRHYRAATTGLSHRELDLKALDTGPLAPSSATVTPETLNLVRSMRADCCG